MQAKTIRFFGQLVPLARWRTLLCETVGREGTAIRPDHTGYSCCFDVAMTADDREAMMRYWYAESGRGESATGRPLKWNDCVGFEIRD